MSTRTPPHYSPFEERLNVGSHALGFVLSLAALVALLWQALASERPDDRVLAAMAQ